MPIEGWRGLIAIWATAGCICIQTTWEWDKLLHDYWLIFPDGKQFLIWPEWTMRLYNIFYLLYNRLSLCHNYGDSYGVVFGTKSYGPRIQWRALYLGMQESPCRENGILHQVYTVNIQWLDHMYMNSHSDTSCGSSCQRIQDSNFEIGTALLSVHLHYIGLKWKVFWISLIYTVTVICVGPLDRIYGELERHFILLRVKVIKE